MTDTRPYLGSRTIESETIQRLHEKPRPPADVGDVRREDRGLVGKLKAPSASGGSSKNRGRTTSILYLYGDERRAMRAFIEHNEAYVADSMGDNISPLSKNWQDWEWALLCEEWQFWKHERGELDDVGLEYGMKPHTRRHQILSAIGSHDGPITSKEMAADVGVSLSRISGHLSLLCTDMDVLDREVVDERYGTYAYSLNENGRDALSKLGPVDPEKVQERAEKYRN